MGIKGQRENRPGVGICSLQGQAANVIIFWVIEMPRKARTASSTNIYHVMLRGINKQVIFEEDGDRWYFLSTLKYCKEVSGFRLYAFCLMSNHVHLLLETGEEPLETVFKRIGSRYVKWFNQKYQRTGHLFQDRFRSENVETDRYFMTVLRYILQNPMKAGMEFEVGKYRWTSYRAYEHGGGNITDTEYAEAVFGGRDKLIAFCKQENDDRAMEENEFNWRIQDDEAIEIMNRISKCGCVSEFQQLDRELKRIYVREMYLERLSQKQISRITGMAEKTIAKAVQEINPVRLDERRSMKFHEEELPEYDFTGEEEEIW